ncbi:TetR/AcrR family transcriptional regulator [Hydrogenophaga sp. 5NK40-0174]|uniref:TetR/AcrR family transcriptional regulator n=1 Tax=Hydrogenophaga sp. 5NK40-0174 TaxID=3127649 RepID=UPI003106DACF
MPSSVASTTKRERRKQARPGELLAAALSLFVEKGYAATRVDEVAARAGVSKGTLFLYFASKEELFKAVVRESIGGRLDEWKQIPDSFEGSSVELLQRMGRVWWERIGMTQASGITKLVLSEAGAFPEMAAFYRKEVIEPGHDILRRVLKRGIDRGEFRPLDIESVIHSLIAPMIYLSLSRHCASTCEEGLMGLDPLTYLDTQIELILHGLVRVTASSPA